MQFIHRAQTISANMPHYFKLDVQYRFLFALGLCALLLSLSTSTLAIPPDLDESRPQPASLPLHLEQLQSRIDYLNYFTFVAWQPIEFKRKIRLNFNDPLVPELRRRLLILGDLEPNTHSSLYDEELMQAMRSFQARHGLNPDGVYGPNTLQWLNISPAQRAQILELNLLRQQSFYAAAWPSYLLVNIPQYQLKLIDEHNTVMTSKVIVGRNKRPTPELHGLIENVVLNPTWTVPRSILNKDLLPKIRKDGDFLQKRNFAVKDAQGQNLNLADYDWAAQAQGDFPYRLVQQPGPQNALGRYKFYFNNPKAIFLHDTPSKGLFTATDRNFSSGCVRVEKVEELANWLALNRAVDENLWRNSHQQNKANQWMRFRKPLAVHLVYWTAWMDDQDPSLAANMSRASTSIPQFRSDIYAKDMMGFESVENLLSRNP